jgi:predicted MFS family arabinose efflux permease
VGGRRILLLLFAAGAAALLAVTSAQTYVWLLGAVAATGFSQSLSNPVTNHVIAGMVPAGRRGLLMGTKQSGVQLGQFLAGATLPAAAAVVGWRAAASGSVILAVVGFALVLVVVPDRRCQAEAGARDPEGQREALPPGVWWLTAYAFLMGAALQAANVHLPLYAFEEVRLSAVVAGATTGVMGAVGLVSRIGWGRIVEHVRSPTGPLVSLALAATISVLFLAVASPATPSVLWLGVAIHAATVMSSNVVVMMAVVDLAPSGQVGRSSGILAVGMYVGFAIGPVSFGALADASGGYTAGWAILAVVYLVAAGLILAWSRQMTVRRDGASGTGPSCGDQSD